MDEPLHCNDVVLKVDKSASYSSEYGLTFLCGGYLRQHFLLCNNVNIQPYDFATIVMKMVGHTIHYHCNFIGKNLWQRINKIKTVIFSNIDIFTHCNMLVQHTFKPSIESGYHGINFSCGIVAIPKRLGKKKISNPNAIQHFKKQFEQVEYKDGNIFDYYKSVQIIGQSSPVTQLPVEMYLVNFLQSRNNYNIRYQSLTWRYVSYRKYSNSWLYQLHLNAINLFDICLPKRQIDVKKSQIISDNYTKYVKCDKTRVAVNHSGIGTVSGTVRFIGKVKDKENEKGKENGKKQKKFVNEEMVGIETDNALAIANDGTYDGNNKSYFKCQDKHGLFVPKSNTNMIYDKKNTIKKNFDIKCQKTIVGVCIDIENQSMHFIKNNQMSFKKKLNYKSKSQTIMKRKFGNISQQLDFTKFDYYFGISSQVCSDEGNQWQINFV